MRYLLGLCLIGLFFGCNKHMDGQHEVVSPRDPRLAQAEAFLKDSPSSPMYDSLDFDRVELTTPDSGANYFVRVPFTGVDLAQRFVLVKTNSAYLPVEGTVIKIHLDSIAKDVFPPTLGFYGSIQKSFLNGTEVYHSAVNGGYIQVLHLPGRTTDFLALEDDEEYVELPEIIIYAPDDGDSYGPAMYYFESMVGGGGGGGGSTSGYFPAGGGGGGSASSSASSYATSELNELQAAKPGIDLQQYFNCFDNVPSDANTTYSAALLVKVPSTSNPNVMWDPTQADGVGHTFIELTKTNGTTSYTQYIGFYGQGGLYGAETALGFSVPSKMVDNSGHPYNAKLTVNLSGTQFSQMLTDLQSYSMAKYNLSSYNCTTYALSAFDNVLPNDLTVPPMAIPGQAVGDTPNGLFIALEGLPANGPQGQVSISSAPQTAGTGHGPCD